MEDLRRELFIKKKSDAFCGNRTTYETYSQLIIPQQAQQIAIQRIPGQVIHVDTEMENGTLVYEVFILTSQNRVYEV